MISMIETMVERVVKVVEHGHYRRNKPSADEVREKTTKDTITTRLKYYCSSALYGVEGVTILPPTCSLFPRHHIVTIDRYEHILG
jgi:hypothetical protein